MMQFIKHLFWRVVMALVRVESFPDDVELDLNQGEHYMDEDKSVFVVNADCDLVDIGTGETYTQDALVGLRLLDNNWSINICYNDD